MLHQSLHQVEENDCFRFYPSRVFLYSWTLLCSWSTDIYISRKPTWNRGTHIIYGEMKDYLILRWVCNSNAYSFFLLCFLLEQVKRSIKTLRNSVSNDLWKFTSSHLENPAMVIYPDYDHKENGTMVNEEWVKNVTDRIIEFEAALMSKLK